MLEDDKLRIHPHIDLVATYVEYTHVNITKACSSIIPQVIHGILYHKNPEVYSCSATLNDVVKRRSTAADLSSVVELVGLCQSELTV